MTRLAGAVVVVTGASGGIGAATARLLAQRGAHVVGVGRNAAALAALAAETGGSAIPVDLAEPASAASIVETVLQRHGRLDAVVLGAGVGHAGAVADMSPDRVAELVDVNVRAPILLAQASIPALLRQGSGSLVFLTSIAGRVGVPGESVYSATKAALETFADAVREELRPSGVTVSTVAPGVVATEFFARRGAPYDRRFPRPMPAGRVAEAVVAAVEKGIPSQVVPRWLEVPARLSATAPVLYRALARRFG